jgi:hypothetical protein
MWIGLDPLKHYKAFLIQIIMEWTKVLYNGFETNIEVTKCAKVRKVKTNWYGNHFNSKIGEVDFSKLKLDSHGYIRLGIQINGLEKKSVRLHQLIAAAFLDYEFNGSKLVIDHIDSNPLNNNIDNLRIVTFRENVSKEKTIKSGLPVGVWFDKSRNKYFSQIYINNKHFKLGRFNTIEEASNAYHNKLKSLSIR